MTLAIGTKIGRYEIRSQLGAGGMGEVYLAQDTKLDRKVALKVLPEDVASNRSRMQRFVQEAKAASALNHPNIITIHEIGTDPGAHFMATEFIDGEDLRHHLRHAPLTLLEAIDIAIQVASALASAHAAGIIHRDIKPDNIMIRRDGITKVLDFGLAKLAERWRADEVDRDAATQAFFHTEPGTVVGTTAYLSPEQARALEVDTRTDIWSLGVVLYEMITRHAPFKGDTAGDTSANILKTEPPSVSQFAPEAPAEIERIVRKALQKDREERYQTVKDMLLDLKSLRRDLEVAAAIQRSGAPLSHEQGPSEADLQSLPPHPHISTQASALSQQLGLTSGARWLWLATILLISGLALGGWFWWRHRLPDANRFSAFTVTQLVSRKNGLNEIASHARFSPDGKFVAYAAARGGKSAIWLKQVGSGEPFANQSDLAYAKSPIWSPDGLQVAFLSQREGQNGIWTMAAFGGSPTLLKLVETHTRELVGWSRDGKIYFGVRGNLYALDVATQVISPVSKFDNSKSLDRSFALSPNEEQVVYSDSSDGQSDIWIVPTPGGQPVRVTNDKAPDSNPVWTPDGQSIVYSSTRNGLKQICQARLDGSQPVQLTVNDSNSTVLDVSPDGTKILYSTNRDECDLWSVKLDRGNESQLTSESGIELWPDIGPDGETVAFQATHTTAGAGATLFNCLVLTKSLKSDAAATQLASDGFAPLWSPDGKQVAFLRFINGTVNLWMVHATGGDAKPLTNGDVRIGGFAFLPYNRLQTQDFQWSPDSGRLIYCANTSGVSNVWQIGIDGSAPVQLSENTDANTLLFNPTWSSDGQRVAWLATSRGQKQASWSIWLFADGQQKQIFQSDSMLGLVGWSPSGEELIVKSDPGPGGVSNAPVDVSLSAISVRDGKQRSLAQLPVTYFQNIKLAPAGNQIAFVTRRDGADSLQVIAASGGAPKTILTSSDPRVYFSTMAWSPDAKTICYGKQSSWTVFSIIDNFK
jgi:eukaryotic-like serine/threonine-protein kinase